jgi:hypothetical protein
MHGVKSYGFLQNKRGLTLVAHVRGDDSDIVENEGAIEILIANSTSRRLAFALTVETDGDRIVLLSDMDREIDLPPIPSGSTSRQPSYIWISKRFQVKSSGTADIRINVDDDHCKIVFDVQLTDQRTSSDELFEQVGVLLPTRNQLLGYNHSDDCVADLTASDIKQAVREFPLSSQPLLGSKGIRQVVVGNKRLYLIAGFPSEVADSLKLKLRISAAMKDRLCLFVIGACWVK